MNVTAKGTPAMSVTVNPGSAQIPTGSSPTNYAYIVAVDTTGGESVDITTANGSNPRIDLIVAYVAKNVTPVTTVVNNSNNMLRLVAVAGTPAATPTAPNTAAIQSAIGAANPYIILAQVLVGAGVTQITSPNVTDKRTMASSNIANGAVASAKIADGAVTPAKRSGGFKVGTIPSSTFGSTGNKSITGLGFRPKMVRFDVASNSSATSITAYGAMDETGTQYAYSTSANGGSAARLSRTNSCILTTSTGGTQDVNYEAQYVSMDSDGFTFNVVTSGGAHDMNWMAFA